MKTSFHISFSLRCADSVEVFARFELGNDRTFAYDVFNQMQGFSSIHGTLLIELVELKEYLPVNLKLMSCSLDQLAVNCRTITKEIFKAKELQHLSESL